jgi:hypothetical protein
MTVSVESRFAHALEKLLDEMGLKQHGRLSITAGWAGITPSGMRRAMDRDSCLRADHLEGLVTGLVEGLEQKGHAVSREAVSKFLMGAGPYPVGTRQTSGGTLSVADGGELLVFLHGVAASKGVKLFAEFDASRIDRVIEKLISVRRSGLGLDHPALQEIAGLHIDAALAEKKARRRD